MEYRARSKHRAMPLVLQHRLAAAIVLTALAATAAVFAFARPEYRQPGQGKSLSFSEADPPSKGWTWADGTPGFHFGEHNDEWNISLVNPRELTAARPAAVAAGVEPDSLGLLQASRSALGVRPQVLLAGRDASGSTCIGAQPHRGPVSFYCPRRLDGVIGIVLAEASPARYRNHGMFLTGVARADVTRVTVTTPGATYTDARGTKPVVRPLGEQPTYERRSGNWWGTFVQTTAQPGLWHARIVFYGRAGKLASADVRFARSGEQIAVVRG